MVIAWMEWLNTTTGPIIFGVSCVIILAVIVRAEKKLENEEDGQPAAWLWRGRTHWRCDCFAGGNIRYLPGSTASSGGLCTDVDVP